MKHCLPVVAISVMLMQTITTIAQSRVLTYRSMAHASNTRVETQEPNAAEGSLESGIPRDGLHFYFEMTGAGLAALIREPNGTATVSKMLAAGPVKISAADLLAFVMTNLPALSNARIAHVGYGSRGAAIIVESPNQADATQLRSGVASLLARNRTGDLEVITRGRLLFVGSPAVVARLMAPTGERTLVEDKEFMKARSRFSEEPLFAFVELNVGSFGLSGGADIAQTPAMLAAMSGLPYAVALGATFQGEMAAVRALLINGSKPIGGPFAGVVGGLLLSATSGAPGQSNAANLVPSNTDVFVDLTINWDKFVEAIESVFGMFAGAVAAGVTDGRSNASPQPSGMQGPPDFLAQAEAALGFSIKNDLIPTLGNEIAITLSGLNNPSTQSTTSGRKSGKNSAKSNPPQFMFLVAVRDEVKFERLLAKLMSGPMGTAQPLMRSTYRGVIIKSGKSMSYAIAGGFLMVCGGVAGIRRALDAHALGDSLGSTSEFRNALGSSETATLQAYLSSRMTREILDSLFDKAAKSGGSPDEFRVAAGTAMPIGLSLMPDEDGLLVEARLPAGLITMALTRMFNAKPAPYGIGSSPSGGMPDSTSRRTNGRATPRLTTDDVKSRRP